ncbi:MAG: hypothetical protein F2663_04185 [Actinobacteria bacterium]|uniref:Unannotated protein n=1 Tax=freshwater metagenome TaxID=449393 RepID=A0A6J6P8D7_9ZZZZ|nr:hypothetical protein [Actinomycetota bacterium]
MSPTRRQVIAGAAAGVLGAAGVYELVDQLGGSSPKRAASGSLPPEQHLLDGVNVITQEGVEVIVPPRHHAVVTAKVAVDAVDLKTAKVDFEALLAGLERDYVATPTGLGVAVAWSLPYFETYTPAAWATHAPHDRRANKAALLATRSFPSDPESLVLEQNDLAILLRSDVKANIDDAIERLRQHKTISLTTIRRGFAGGGFEGGTSLPKQIATAANIPGADLIPETAELFLGFTSTQKAAFGPGKIANFETLGLVDLRGKDYFANGTAMHLSHIHEDLEAWYVNFTFEERVATAFYPGIKDVRQGQQVVPMGPEQVQTADAVHAVYKSSGRIGHSGPLQTASRLPVALIATDGTHYPKGTAIPIRADFNTIDNPFNWSADPTQIAEVPAAGVHFLVFNPSTDDFHRNRLAMDGVLADGSKIELAPRDRTQGFNSILRTTHRQNFLIPPRRNRSFPLAEV